MKLTPVSGCDVQANSVVAHFVSISVSVREKKKKKGRKNIQVRPIGRDQWRQRLSAVLQQCHKTSEQKR